jgi:hypothetical protein
VARVRDSRGAYKVLVGRREDKRPLSLLGVDQKHLTLFEMK